MAVENVGKYEELLRSDEELQAKLRTATERYEGDSKDARALFDATVGSLAQEVGLPFTYEEAMAYMASDRELDDDELEVAAGDSACYIIGKSDGEDTWACTTWDYGAGACDYVGITLLQHD